MAALQRRGSFDVPAALDAPRRARRAVLEALPFIPISRRYDVALVVSELVQNSIAHGGLTDDQTVEVSWDAARDLVTITVDDEGTGIPANATGGFGFQLVNHLVETWEIDEDDPTRVTCTIRLKGSSGRMTWSTVDDETVLSAAATDQDARDEALARYSNLTSSIARRFRNRGIAQEDLEQVASMALIKAINRFDPEAGSFVSYAQRTISGELKRHLRDRAWSVRVPRSLQELSLEVGRASADLTQRLGRQATIEELSDATGRTVDDVVEALTATGAYQADSLSRPTGDGDFTLLDSLGAADENLDLAERWHGIAPGIARLPERERRILYLRFHEDLTQSEIAEMVGMSQMHVSRLLRSALAKLRELAD